MNPIPSTVILDDLARKALAFIRVNEKDGMFVHPHSKDGTF